MRKQEVSREEFENVLKDIDIEVGDYGRILNIISGYYQQFAFDYKIEGNQKLYTYYKEISEVVYNFLDSRGFYKC